MNTLNSRDLPAKALGMSLILAPLFALASALVAPALKSDEGAQLGVIAQHPDAWYWFTLLLLVSSLLLVPALLGIAALVSEKAPRLGFIGGVLAVGGALISIGDVMSQLMTWQMVGVGADRAQMSGLLERVDTAGGVAAIFTVGGLAVLIGTALLSVGLLRGRVAPAWVALGLSLAVIVNIAGFSASSNAVVGLSWAILLAAMGWIGWQMLAGSRLGRAASAPPAPRPATEAG